MIKNTKKIQVEHANGDILHRLLYESQDCDKNSEESFLIQNELFKTFAQNPHLTVCGSIPFETMTFKFVGTRWLVEFQALEVNKDTV